jgi:hypothetical protein
MRSYVLIAAMLLTSASAQAAGPRGLSATTCSEPAAASQSKQTEAANVDVPKVKEQPAAKDAAPSQSDQSDEALLSRPYRYKPTYRNEPDYRRADDSKRDSLEVRVIDALHRHGIYW